MDSVLGLQEIGTIESYNPYKPSGVMVSLHGHPSRETNPDQSLFNPQSQQYAAWL